MKRELKIKISNHVALEKHLIRHGAKFLEKTFFVDTYFNQPKGEIFKITANAKGFFLTHITESNGQFVILQDEKIADVEQKQTSLTKRYGIKRILKGARRWFGLDDFRILINLIDNVGEFLVLTGANPTEKFMIEKLALKNPEYIRVSFDELPNL